MTEPRVNLEELKAAEAAATPEPWDVDGVGGIQMDGISDGYVIWTEENRRLASLYPSAHKDRITRYSDAKLIPLMRNALPALIAEVEASREWKAVSVSTIEMFEREEERMQAENEALRKALQAIQDVLSLPYESKNDSYYDQQSALQMARLALTPADATHEQEASDD